MRCRIGDFIQPRRPISQPVQYIGGRKQGIQTQQGCSLVLIVECPIPQERGTPVRDEAPYIVRLSGDYDVYTIPQLESDLKASDTARNVVLDFHLVKYIDSAAIAALLRMKGRRSAAGMPEAQFASL